MAQKMRVDDGIRLNILNALLKKNCVQPNLKRIKTETKYHLATIKGSLDFLHKEDILKGYGPKLAFWKLGYKLETVELLQLDFSKSERVEEYLKVVDKDPHVWQLTSIMGSGNFNVMSLQFYEDVESYHRNLQERYVKKIKDYYDIVKDRQVFYLTEPHFKKGSRTDSIIDLMRKKIAID